MSMYKRTRAEQKALWASAEHWLDNWAHPESASMAPRDCACCLLDEALGDGSCTACPIYHHTGQYVCHGTPYVEAANSLQYFHSANPYHDQRYMDKKLADFRKAAEAEYRFLVTLALNDDHSHQ